MLKISHVHKSLNKLLFVIHCTPTYKYIHLHCMYILLLLACLFVFFLFLFLICLSKKFNKKIAEMEGEFCELKEAGKKWGSKAIPEKWMEEFRELSPGTC